MTQTKRVRVHHLREAKERGERLTMLTAYDAVTAHIFDEAGIDMLLVGDSIGTTMHGPSGTIEKCGARVKAFRAVPIPLQELGHFNDANVAALLLVKDGMSGVR